MRYMGGGRLDGKIVVLTGGAGEIGLAVSCRRCVHRRGSHVLLGCTHSDLVAGMAQVNSTASNICTLAMAKGLPIESSADFGQTV